VGLIICGTGNVQWRAEPCGEPERRIGRQLKSTVLGRRRVTLVVRCTGGRDLSAQPTGAKARRSDTPTRRRRHPLRLRGDLGLEHSFTSTSCSNRRTASAESQRSGQGQGSEIRGREGRRAVQRSDLRRRTASDNSSTSSGHSAQSWCQQTMRSQAAGPWW
jgi:hypothetical protein